MIPCPLIELSPSLKTVVIRGPGPDNRLDRHLNREQAEYVIERLKICVSRLKSIEDQEDRHGSTTNRYPSASAR